MKINFYEDVEIGKSLVMFADNGSITTSPVIFFSKYNSIYIIETKNSIYYISIII